MCVNAYVGICGNVCTWMYECENLCVYMKLYICMCLCVFMCTCVYVCAEFVWLKKLFISVWHTTNWSYIVRTNPCAPGTYNQSISLLISPSPFFAFSALTVEQALNREGVMVRPLAYDPTQLLTSLQLFLTHTAATIQRPFTSISCWRLLSLPTV